MIGPLPFWDLHPETYYIWRVDVLGSTVPEGLAVFAMGWLNKKKQNGFMRHLYSLSNITWNYAMWKNSSCWGWCFSSCFHFHEWMYIYIYIHIYIYIYIWRFPTMLVSPKHPKMIIFSRKTHGCWVNPPYKHANMFSHDFHISDHTYWDSIETNPPALEFTYVYLHRIRDVL